MSLRCLANVLRQVTQRTLRHTMASAAGGTAAVVAPEARPGSTVVEKFQDDAIYQDIVTHAVQDGEDADKSDTQIADSEPESQQSTLCESGQDQQEPLSQDARSLHELEARSLPYSNTLNDLWPGVWPRRVVALRDFEVRPAGGYIFDVKEGDDFEITRLLPGDWYEARIRGKICRIPSLYVRIMNPEDSSSLASFEKTLNEAAKAVQTATRYLDAQSNAKQPPDPAILQRVEDLGRARAKAKIASVDYALLQHAHGTATTVQRVRALYDFTPSELGELAFQKNDTIAVLGSVYKDWWKGYRKGQTGIFPLNYVEAYEGTQIELECDGSTDCGSARCPWLHQGEVLKPPLQRTDSLQPPSVSQKPATVSADPAAATETKQSELSDKSGLTITVDHAVGNVNYGPKTRMELRSRSVLPYQARENRQKTPPIPSPPPKAASPQLKQPTGERVHRDRQLEVREGLFDAGKGELFYTLTRRENSEMPKTSVLNIATLQHMALHQIQYDIACYVKYMYQTSQFWMQVGKFPPLTALLHDYCESRQYSYHTLPCTNAETM